jgi:hypothetical protein
MQCLVVMSSGGVSAFILLCVSLSASGRTNESRWLGVVCWCRVHARLLNAYALRFGDRALTHFVLCTAGI